MARDRYAGRAGPGWRDGAGASWGRFLPRFSTSVTNRNPPVSSPNKHRYHCRAIFNIWGLHLTSDASATRRLSIIPQSMTVGTTASLIRRPQIRTSKDIFSSNFSQALLVAGRGNPTSWIVRAHGVDPASSDAPFPGRNRAQSSVSWGSGRPFEPGPIH